MDIGPPKLLESIEGMEEPDKTECYISVAKLAEQAERYEDMVQYMQKVSSLLPGGDALASSKDDSSEKNSGQDNRNLISVGYKNMIAARRAAHRNINVPHPHDQRDQPGNAADLVQKYKDTIAKEIDEIIDMVVRDTIKPFTEGAKAATDAETVCFFKKMEGDYYRYGSETSADDTRPDFAAKHEDYKKKATAAYEAAHTASTQGASPLPPTNPIRLGLALNQSVFLYEIARDHKAAKDLAKEAFDEAIKELDSLPEDQYKDSTLIMQLLKDNLKLWEETEETEADGDIEVQDVED